MCLIYKNSVGDPPCHTPAESKQTWARNDLNLEDSEKSLEDFSPLPSPKHTHFNQDDILDNSTPCVFQSHGIRVRVEVEHRIIAGRAPTHPSNKYSNIMKVWQSHKHTPMEHDYSQEAATGEQAAP